VKMPVGVTVQSNWSNSSHFGYRAVSSIFEMTLDHPRNAIRRKVILKMPVTFSITDIL